jgi:methylmalonyl-CoA mutase cobalamin-binding domain/chain
LSVDRQTILDELRNLVSIISDIDTVRKTTEKALASGVKPTEIVDSLSEALNDVGKKYDRGEYFLSELMMGGVLAVEVMNIVKPQLTTAERKTLGKVIIGTVKGDLHDIGKNIVIMMLSAVGFDVIDLGVDVPAEKFAETTKKEKADVLGMSALLSSTVGEMKNVIELLKKEKLRDSIKVIVGGRPLTREFADEIGADGFGKDAAEAVDVTKELVKSKR